MATVIFKHKDTARQTTLKAGQRLLFAGYGLGFEELGFGDCGGNMVCGSCHVRVIKGSFAPPKPDEQDVLAVFPKLYPESRLACQLRVTDENQEIEVEWVG